MQLVDNLQDIKNNIETFESYRTLNNSDTLSWYKQRIKLGTCFYLYKYDGAIHLAPSRFIGYLDNDAEKHENADSKDGRITNSKLAEILGTKPEISNDAEILYNQFCSTLGIEPNLTGSFGTPRKYWVEHGLDISHDTPNSINKDLDEINGNDKLTSTEKEVLTKARMGQGKFRDKLIEHWAGCAMTGCKEFSLLRASHIKPWRYSNNEERLDVFNGILLTPNYDLLFDQGYISFSETGKIIISDLLNKESQISFSINDNATISLSSEYEKYMKFHRQYILKMPDESANLKY